MLQTLGWQIIFGQFWLLVFQPVKHIYDSSDGFELAGSSKKKRRLRSVRTSKKNSPHAAAAAAAAAASYSVFNAVKVVV